MNAVKEYDEIYARSENFFGAGPDPLLKRFADRIEPGGTALDVGSGQGRNALFLARRGYTVDALDPSAKAAEDTTAAARAEGLPVRAHACGFETFAVADRPYEAVLLFGLIQVLTREELGLLSARVVGWTAPGGLVFATAFSTEDDSYSRCRQSWKRIGRHSFTDPDQDGPGTIKTYLEPGEILDLFAGFEPLHHWEGLGAEHSHAGGPVERHARIEAVLRKSSLGPNYMLERDIAGRNPR